MYEALVTVIKTTPHPNADRLLIGDCNGFQVVASINTADGALGIFFPCDGQLSTIYCEANFLYPEFNDEGVRIGGGFIDPKNNRVRAQKFRGVNSEGLWMPLSSLASFGDISTLKEGDTFTAFNDVEICSKWFNKATRDAMAGRKGANTRKETPWLLMHPDTSQLKCNVHNIREGQRITITEKLHGTSQRSGWSWSEVDTPLLKFLEPLMRFKWLRPLISKKVSKYVFLNGTRRVLVPTFATYSGFYSSESFRVPHEQLLRAVLPEGYQIYYEVVGFRHGDNLIMPECDNAKISKDFVKLHGKTTRFTYGCKPGESRMFAYALTYTSPSNERIMLSYDEMAHLCYQWGIPVVPKLCEFTVSSNTDILAIANSFTDGLSLIDSSHIREGVCLQVLDPGRNTSTFLKNKSREFYILEDVIKSGDAVDLEELESY